MSALLKECADEGITSEDSVRARFASEGKYDAEIRKLLKAAGISGDVTSRDRDSYNIWTNYWHIPTELLEYAAKSSLGDANPRARMHSLVKSYNEHGITKVSQIKKSGAAIMSKEYDTSKLNEKIKSINPDEV